MNKTPENLNTKQHLDAVLEKLAVPTVDVAVLTDVATQLNKFGSSPPIDADQIVVRGAKLMAFVSELAASWDQNDGDGTGSHDELVAFVQDGVLVLDDAVAGQQRDEEIQTLFQSANENWPDYMALFDDPSCDGGSSGTLWDTADTNDLVDEDASAPDSGQIAMMLQALSEASQSSDVEISPDASAADAASVAKAKPASKPASQQPSTQPSVSDQPAMADEASTESDFIPKPPQGADESAINELAKDPEMLEAYLDDALRCVASMEQSALQVEENASDREPVRQFCRELHTLKGASATVGLSELADYLHNLESSLEAMFGDDQADADAEKLFAAVDQVRSLIESLQPNNTATVEPGGVLPSSDSPAVSAAVSITKTTAKRSTSDFANYASGDDASIRIRASKLDRLMDMLAELVVLRNRQESDVADFDELNEELSRCSARVSVANDHRRAEQASLYSAASGADDLGGSSAVLAEVSKDIAAVSRGLRDLQKPIAQNNGSISRFIRDFRQELMQLRRVPVIGMFTRLQRAARDAAKTESKKVRVELLGENAGLEQEIQERLFESLLHIVRNSVSHGVESKQDRIKAGKDAVGTVTLEATSNAQLLIIEVRDDGGGIDYAAIRERGIEKGLISANHDVSQEQLGKLIFHPGFSTRQTASAVSGRGVGMEIVQTTIDQLKGRIEVDSRRGVGTTIRIMIPLRSGIEHVMVFRSDDQLFALPMQAVSSAKRNHQAAGISVANLLGSQASSPGTAAEALHIRHSNTHRNGDDTTLAIAVDEILGPEEVVVRNLPFLLRSHPLFNGITLSGGGKKVLLLDAEQFAIHCEQSDANPSATANASSESNATPDQKRVLVVDDSLTARRALSKVMQSLGFHVSEAGDGVAAVDILRKQTFDLVMTDLDMPRMGGLELLADIQTGSYCDAPRVVVSSRNEQTFREQASEAGATEFITKPISKSIIQQFLGELNLIEPIKGKSR